MRIESTFEGWKKIWNSIRKGKTSREISRIDRVTEIMNRVVKIDLTERGKKKSPPCHVRIHCLMRVSQLVR